MVLDSRPEPLPLEPILVCEVELGQPLSSLFAFDQKTGQRYHRAMCLVRLHTQPLGVVELRLDTDIVSPAECAGQIWAALKHVIIEHLRHDGLADVDSV